MRARFAALLAAWACGAAWAGSGDSALLDGFEDASAWKADASEEVTASLRETSGVDGRALCLDFDFGSVSGYAVARRALALSFPADFELSFDVRSDARPNAFEVKLVDASGQNVWWWRRADFDFPRDWRTVRVKKRQIEFAWGPTQNRALGRTAAIEFVVARGHGGGKGSLCVDNLRLRERQADAAMPAPVVVASSSIAGSSPALAIDSIAATAWRSDPAAGAEQSMTLDFGRARELGGLVLRWLPGQHATRYTVESSDDAASWHVERMVEAGNGGVDPLFLGEVESRYLRIRMHAGAGRGYALAEVEVKDAGFGADPNAFFTALAKEAPRGHYPRGFSGEQAYWTVVGIDGGRVQGLLSEDGALEVAPSAPAVEPMLLTEDGLVTWADAAIEQSLRGGDLPMPSVAWRAKGLSLRIDAFGHGTRSRSQVIARYTLENHSPSPRRVTLVLGVRPFQVNPPTQFLNTPGGVAAVREARWDGRMLSIDGDRHFIPLATPSEVFAAPFDAGGLPELLASRTGPVSKAVKDASGFASAAMLFRMTLPPHGKRVVGLIAPWTGAAERPRRSPEAWMQAREKEAAAAWREKLGRVVLRVPPEARPLAAALRTALAHILVDRAGPALQPGTRAYARTWIRDGALSAEALLRLGHGEAAREFADWFAPYQFANGKVPCCVDYRGADPVPENDSHGEFIHLVAEIHRHTGDRRWLGTMWPAIGRAVGYMDALRAGEASGLMPPSISHEGYSDKPAYSYWDDFWALVGYRDAVEMARALGDAAEIARLEERRVAFHRALMDSIAASVSRHGIDYLPGAADRGDFDPTSTTIALAPGGALASLPRALVDATFERYWREFVARRDGAASWDAYTPYEWRNVGAFVRLGWRDRIPALLEFFMKDRRPQAWNQWAEVIGREPRAPRFVGDMPHAWVSADFIRSALDLFAYERPADRSLVLAAGVPVGWMNGDGVAIDGMRTPWGLLGYTLRRNDDRLELEVRGPAVLPPGGLAFPWPFREPPREIRVDGRPAFLHDGEIRIERIPARVVASIDPGRR